MAAPMDLNIPLCEKQQLLQKLKMAYQLGYEVVAINNIVPELLLPKKKKKKSDEKLKTPDSIKPSPEELKSILGQSKKPFKILSRVSAVHSDVSQTYFLVSDEVQSYDIVAVQPTCEKTFMQACKDLNVDIITIDVTEKFAAKIKRQTLSPALERGVHFELQYSPGIRDATLRRYFISNAQKLIFWCKGKNVILTSGCEKAIEMRGPYDVANFGLLLNLNENQAKDAVMRNCQAVLSHSEGRRVYSKGTVKVERVTELPNGDSWIPNVCDVSTPDYKVKTGNCKTVATSKIHSADTSDDDNDLDEDEEVEVEPVTKKLKVEET